MKAISTAVWSHNSIASGDRESVDDIATSQGLIVSTYVDLVQCVAEISYKNREFMPLFRGQVEDHLTSRTRVPKSSIVPTIYRPGQGQRVLKSNLLFTRYQALDVAKLQLLKLIGSLPIKADFRKSDYIDFDEIAWSVFQHYEVLPTPLIDVTQSLLVACTFALANNVNQYGYVYILGLESMNPTVYFSYNSRHQLIRLMSLMPKIARRPLHQEGYLLGNFPIRRSQGSNNNLSNRMLAKFRIPTMGFWNRSYHPFQISALLPSKDQMDSILSSLRSQYHHLW
jgi:hypothetical protein